MLNLRFLTTASSSGSCFIDEEKTFLRVLRKSPFVTSDKEKDLNIFFVNLCMISTSAHAIKHVLN